MRRSFYFLAPMLLATLVIGCDSGTSTSLPNSETSKSTSEATPAKGSKAGKKVKNNDARKAMPRPKANPN